VRETLFNWLNPVIAGSRCLDLFAGTGALGFEAASRGAAKVVMVELDPRALAELNHIVLRLHAANIRLVQADTMQWLQTPGERFDIVFLDPPFNQGLIGPCCRLLEESGWLSAKAHIYIETESDLILSLPPSWALQKEGKAGEVRYYLAQQNGAHRGYP